MSTKKIPPTSAYTSCPISPPGSGNRTVAASALERLSERAQASRTPLALGLPARSRAPRPVRRQRRQHAHTTKAQVARLVVEGSSNRQVAARLFISQNTAEYHLQEIFRKLEVSSRTQLAQAIVQLVPNESGV